MNLKTILRRIIGQWLLTFKVFRYIFQVHVSAYLFDKFEKGQGVETARLTANLKLLSDKIVHGLLCWCYMIGQTVHQQMDAFIPCTKWNTRKYMHMYNDIGEINRKSNSTYYYEVHYMLWILFIVFSTIKMYYCHEHWSFVYSPPVKMESEHLWWIVVSTHFATLVSI